jgi:hypothetical protein
MSISQVKCPLDVPLDMRLRIRRMQNPIEPNRMNGGVTGDVRVVDAEPAQRTTTERRTSSVCILWKASSMPSRPMRSETNFSRGSRPWRYRSIRVGSRVRAGSRRTRRTSTSSRRRKSRPAASPGSCPASGRPPAQRCPPGRGRRTPTSKSPGGRPRRSRRRRRCRRSGPEWSPRRRTRWR